MDEQVTSAARHIATLKALIVRENRWKGQEPDEDRESAIAALEWAVGYKYYCQNCDCGRCGNTRPKEKCTCTPTPPMHSLDCAIFDGKRPRHMTAEETAAMDRALERAMTHVDGEVKS
jgi:hypothetical protein